MKWFCYASQHIPGTVLNEKHLNGSHLASFLQNATAWGCFAFSTQPVSITSEAALQAGHMTPVSSPSVMNHVMHASYGEVSNAKGPYTSGRLEYFFMLYGSKAC